MSSTCYCDLHLPNEFIYPDMPISILRWCICNYISASDNRNLTDGSDWWRLLIGIFIFFDLYVRYFKDSALFLGWDLLNMVTVLIQSGRPTGSYITIYILFYIQVIFYKSWKNKKPKHIGWNNQNLLIICRRSLRNQ